MRPTFFRSSAEFYEGIRAGESWTSQICNNVRCCCLHLYRSQELFGLAEKDVASSAEKCKIETLYSKTLTKKTAVVNFLVWRRSALVVLVILSFLYSLSSIFDVEYAIWRTADLNKGSVFQMNYTTWSKKTFDQLPAVDCELVDEAFEDFLTTTLPNTVRVPYSGMVMQLDAPQSCAQLVATSPQACGRLLNDELGRSVLEYSYGNCVWRTCQVQMDKLCPVACGKSPKDSCKDTRRGQGTSYLDYARALSEAQVQKLQGQASSLEVAKAVFLLIVNFVVLGLVVKSASLWINWHSSWRWLLFSWLVSLVAPFIVSSIPLRFLVRWESVDTDFLEFMQNTKEHFGLQDKLEALKGDDGSSLCFMHADDLMKQWNTAKGKVQSLCKIVDSVPEGVLAVGNDMSLAHWACDKLRTWVISADQGAALVLQACAGLDVVWMNGRRPDDAAKLEMFELIKSQLQEVKGAVEAIVGLTNAATAFKNLWPASMSLSPGLVQGSIITKVVVPEAAPPGVFIVLLPWLYCPVAWTLYAVILQLLGSPLLYTGLLLLAWNPIVYSIIGHFSKINSPLLLKRLHYVLKRLYWSSIAMTTVAVTLVVSFIIYDILHTPIEKQEATLRLIRQIISIYILSPKSWAVMLMSFLSKYYLTMLVSVDFIIHTTAEGRLYENIAEGKHAHLIADEHGWVNLDRAKVQAQREEHLDAFVELDFGYGKTKMPPQMSESDYPYRLSPLCCASASPSLVWFR
eukprot:TRINITY_DN39210_c0_g1_i2.p1 TRINITY_DN39210_c0_g1~~TRINITY_DN39210_c0_g1_i2.p1  ORF type:complete len:741 (-),score=124.23 TRINITY_DN39210_c0_g1_i2:64-2286(-)